MSDLDYNIFKALTTDKPKAIFFAREYDHTLFNPECRDSAKMILDYIKAYKTVPTHRTLVERYGDSSDSIDKISKLWKYLQNHEYNNNDFEYDLQELKNRFKKNTVKHISDLLDQKMAAGLEPDVILKEVSLNLHKTSILNSGRSHIQKSVGNYVGEFESRYQARKTTGTGAEIKTGYSMIDAVTGGFAPSELIVIGGSTNSGKSIFLSNVGTQMWLQGNTIWTPPDEFKPGRNVLYFSLEMSYDDCFDRFLAKLADIPQRSVKDACLTENEVSNKNQALKFIEDYQKAGNHFQIVDVPRGVTIEEIELRYQDALLEFKPDIVIVDYMGLMHDPMHSKDPDWLKLGYIAAYLHEFSRAYDIVMVTAVQLTDIKRNNKGKEDDGQRVGPHRIGRSSIILHHVNIGLQIEDRMNERSLPDLRYHIIKNRKGPTANGNLIKQFEHSALHDVPYNDFTQTKEKKDISSLIMQIRDQDEDGEQK